MSAENTLFQNYFLSSIKTLLYDVYTYNSNNNNNSNVYSVRCYYRLVRFVFILFLHTSPVSPSDNNGVLRIMLLTGVRTTIIVIIPM